MLIDKMEVERARKDSAFGLCGWLTFYLDGAPDRHTKMAPGLQKLQAVILVDCAGGSVCAKVPVVVDDAVIERQISNVRTLAEETGVEIRVIGLVASPDTEKSNFHTLWEFS